VIADYTAGAPRAAMSSWNIARVYRATATTAFTGGRGPDGLADEGSQSAARPIIDEEAPHDE
jgi:hypothetical protein